MAKKDTSDHQRKLASFADRFHNEPVPLPIQKVSPMREAAPAEKQLNVYLPEELLMQTKMAALRAGQKLKDFVAEALQSKLTSP